MKIDNTTPADELLNIYARDSFSAEDRAEGELAANELDRRLKEWELLQPLALAAMGLFGAFSALGTELSGGNPAERALRFLGNEYETHQLHVIKTALAYARKQAGE